MKKILFVGFLAGLTGCGGQVQNQAAKYASLLVSFYCAQPQEARMALRALVSKAVAPNRIVIECAADEPVNKNE